MRKRIVALAVVVLVAASIAWAGGEHAKGKMDPAAKAAMLKEKLGLSEAQTEQVRAVLQQTHERYSELKAKGLEGEALKALKAEKTKLMEQHDAKLKSIFTAEQWARFQEMRSQHHKPAKPGETKQ